MTKTKMKHFVCTRPTLAGILEEHGHEGRPTKHLWDARRTMWIFPVDDDLVKIVTEYYKTIGKEPPFERVVASEVQ